MPVQADNAASSLIFHPISQDVSVKISDAVQEIVPAAHEQSGADVLIRHNMADDKPQAESLVEPLAPIPEVAPQETQQEALITKIALQSHPGKGKAGTVRLGGTDPGQDHADHPHRRSAVRFRAGGTDAQRHGRA